MSREPCMTIAELARHTGKAASTLYKRAVKHPLPEEVVFEFRGIPVERHICSSKRQYKRSQLLQWFESFRDK